MRTRDKVKDKRVSGLYNGPLRLGSEVKIRREMNLIGLECQNRLVVFSS